MPSLIKNPHMKSKSNLFVAHFMYKTIQSALHQIKALQQGAEKALRYVKEYK